MTFTRAFLNGNLIPANEAKVSLNAVAFKYGAMVFEGLRAYWNERDEQLYVFRLDAHSRRLKQSVQVMRMDTHLSITDYSGAVLQVLEGNNVRENAHIRQMVYVEGSGEMFEGGPVSHAIIVIAKGSWFTGKLGIHACVTSWQRISDSSMPPRVKCAANYQNGRLALLQARLDGYEGAIFVNSAGKVSEEARGCIFLRRGSQIITPNVTSDILESITRATLIRLFSELFDLAVVERDVDRTELYLADEIFVSGTGFEVVPVLSIDRHQVADGRPGEFTVGIRDAYVQAARGELPQYRNWLTPVYTKQLAVGN